MRFGVCVAVDKADAAAEAGYDYAECGVSSVLRPSEPDEAFRASLDSLLAASLPFPALNCFVPGNLKITGPDADKAKLSDYVSTCMVRAEAAGVEIIVFGSGGARQVPDGFDRQLARDQIVSFCNMVGPMALDHGVTVVVEPLNKRECNILNTVDECGRLVRDVAHPAIKLLADAYHLLLDGDSYDSVVAHGELLAHVHIATSPNRLPPGAEACDLSPFFDALAKARYSGRVSIEGKIANPRSELPSALALLRELAEWSRKKTL